MKKQTIEPRVLVGTPFLGPGHAVPVYLTWITGNSCFYTGDRNRDPHPEIVLGLRQEWAEQVDAMMHECMEMALWYLGVSFSPDNYWDSNSSENRLFVMPHGIFAEAVSRSASAFAYVEPELRKQWRALLTGAPQKRKKR